MLAFRDVVLTQDFEGAQTMLAALSNVVAQAWPSLPEEERALVHTDLMAVLEWARISVTSGREHIRTELERIEGAKVYRMPDPRKRASWNMQA
jgi:hypothetical protein